MFTIWVKTQESAWTEKYIPLPPVFLIEKITFHNFLGASFDQTWMDMAFSYYLTVFILKWKNVAKGMGCLLTFAPADKIR